MVLWIRKSLMRYFNKDITDEELEMRLQELEPEVEEEATPQSPLLAALRG